MLSLVFCTLFLGAMAMPYYPDYFLSTSQPPRMPPRLPMPPMPPPPFKDGDLTAILSQELKYMEEVSPLPRRFPSVSQAGVKDNEYIHLSLPRYEDKDIVVKARKGWLMVQAVHKIDHDHERNYTNFMKLPDTVNVTGNWVFERGVLKIYFPLKEAAQAEVTTETVVAENPQRWVDFEVSFDADRFNPDAAGLNTNRGDFDEKLRDNNVRGLREIPALAKILRTLEK